MEVSLIEESATLNQPITRFFRLATLTALLVCAGSLLAREKSPDGVERGEYLTTILGCGGCHTEGALLGRQSGPWLAGSRIGVAYSAPDPDEHPAVVFPPNLTNDPETGLGRWSEREIARAIRTGRGHAETTLIPVMPWQNYSLLTAEDARAIAAYLKSLPGVERAIPENVAEGTPSDSPYLRVGMFMFDPKARPTTGSEGAQVMPPDKATDAPSP